MGDSVFSFLFFLFFLDFSFILILLALYIEFFCFCRFFCSFFEWVFFSFIVIDRRKTIRNNQESFL